MKKRVVVFLLTIVLAGNMSMSDLVVYAANAETSAPVSVVKTETTPEQELTVSDNTPAQEQEENEKPADNESWLNHEEQAENETDGEKVETDTDIESALEAEILYSGKDGDLDWSIDSEGLLTISGVGDWEREYTPEWCDYGDMIITAKIAVSGITSTEDMFRECKNLKTVDFSKFDTSLIKDMSGMFYSCGSLESLDISNFTTKNVTSMSCMFFKCSSLTNLNMSGLDTSQA